MTAKLELRGVRKNFGDVIAVNDCSLTLHRGEFLSLLGPSGCGKSTTLAMIAGFLDPDAGDILIDGNTVNQLPVQKRRVGLVFQDYAIFNRLSVRENLEFGLKSQKVARDERRKIVDEYAEKLDLTGILKRSGGALNMSEMQRVALARALVTRPELLLLDEPMSNLDAALRAALRAELKHIQRELDQTVLYVTHDQVEAMSMSDRIAVMQSGALVQIDSPEQIFKRPINRFVAEFIGDPPANIVACEVAVAGGRVTATTALHQGVDIGRGDPGAGRFLLIVRPHQFLLHKDPTEGAALTRVQLVENFGSEHVYHVEHGDDLVAVVGTPGYCREGDDVHLGLDNEDLLLIDPSTSETVPLESPRAAA